MYATKIIYVLLGSMGGWEIAKKKKNYQYNSKVWAEAD
jgi:hypothetical protein